MVETMRAALHALAIADPAWLRAHLQPEWARRYMRLAEQERLPAKPEMRSALAEKFGADGMVLRQSVYAVNAPSALRQLPAIEVLRRVFMQNYHQTQQGLEWREADNLPPVSCFLSSPTIPMLICVRRAVPAGSAIQST